MDLALSSRTVGTTAILAVGGEIDMATTDQLRRALDELIDGSTRVVCDLTDVTFIESTGIGVFVAARKHLLARRGSLVLVAPRPAIRRILELVGLLGVFDVRESVAEAIPDAG